MNILLRKAEIKDVPLIYQFIKELALFERAPNEVTITLQDLIKDGFGSNPIFEVILAYADNEPAGMAFYYNSYSTWKGKCLYLEDIIVKEEMRGKGVGKKLFEAVIEKAKSTDARRMHWQVLDWNSDAIEFYKKYGAFIDNTWLNGKFTYEKLQEMVIDNKE